MFVLFILLLKEKKSLAWHEHGRTFHLCFIEINGSISDRLPTFQQNSLVSLFSPKQRFLRTREIQHTSDQFDLLRLKWTKNILSLPGAMRTQLEMILMVVAAVTINLCYYWHSVHQFCHWVWDSIRTMFHLPPISVYGHGHQSKEKNKCTREKIFLKKPSVH